jgi:uncharacterized protein YhaN
MRIRRLGLLRYGHVTDTDFQPPAGQPDFHVVYGPNESGKSTALSAIEDLLFGIPHNSTRNFLHDHNSMRVGALLESGAETLEIRGRKGNADLIGQLGDPNYMRNSNALFYEFQEIDLNKNLSYETAADIVYKVPQFYWTKVAPQIQLAIRYLNVT